jgi:hypothetical protein
LTGECVDSVPNLVFPAAFFDGFGRDDRDRRQDRAVEQGLDFADCVAFSEGRGQGVGSKRVQRNALKFAVDGGYPEVRVGSDLGFRRA